MRRLILLGGGHAHAHVLRRAARTPLAGVDLVLISPSARHHYSGMVPGYLHGAYSEDELAIDLAALARRAGARFLLRAAEHIDVAARTVAAGGERLAFDLLSVDVGSDTAGASVPGVREHALSVRPMSRAVALRRRADEVFAAARGAAVPVLVVGAGAAGFEVALALERRGRALGARPAVKLIDAASAPLPGFAERAQRRAALILGRRGVGLALGRSVTAVEADAVHLDDGQALPSALTVWLTGAAAPDFFASSSMPRDRRGFLAVDATLRAVDGSPVFGAGDCIGIDRYPSLPKAGVYAVREAPILEANLRAVLAGSPLRRYVPQRTFLALLNTADGRALLRWHGLVVHTRLAMLLKDRIDRAFLRRFRVSP